MVERLTTGLWRRERKEYAIIDENPRSLVLFPAQSVSLEIVACKIDTTKERGLCLAALKRLGHACIHCLYGGADVHLPVLSTQVVSTACLYCHYL